MKMIFVHGAGCGPEVWEYQLRHFRDAVAIALPGRPGSDGATLSSAEEYAEWLRSYVQSRGYTDVVLVGHSFGSAVCQIYALNHPDELKGLVLIGSGARIRVHPDMFASVDSMMSDDDAWRSYVLNEFSWAAEEDRERLAAARTSVTPAVMRSDLEACNRFDIMERVGEISVPTLVICGTEDWATPVKYANFLADKIPGASLLTVEGATHYVFGEQPAQVNEAIEKFLSALV